MTSAIFLPLSPASNFPFLTCTPPGRFGSFLRCCRRSLGYPTGGHRSPAVLLHQEIPERRPNLREIEPLFAHGIASSIVLCSLSNSNDDNSDEILSERVFSYILLGERTCGEVASEFLYLASTKNFFLEILKSRGNFQFKA